MTSVAADDSYDSDVEQADDYAASLLAEIKSDLHRVRRSPHHHHHGGTSSSSSVFFIVLLILNFILKQLQDTTAEVTTVEVITEAATV